MKTIWEYKISLTDEYVFTTHKGARVLSVGLQADGLYVWVAVDDSQPRVDHKLRVAGTGHPLVGLSVEALHVFHIGTVQMPNGLVWHVFDWGEVPPTASS